MTNISRRSFLLGGTLTVGSFLLSGGAVLAAGNNGVPVYFSKNISAEGLVDIYDSVMMGRKLPGKVAVKLHSGEPGGHNYPAPELVKSLVAKVDGTIVECNTAYRGKRYTTEEHMKALEDHGFTGIASVDIMDENGSVALDVPGGKHLKKNYVGANFNNYDSYLILSHFKGHAMGGFGGAIKNMSIGIASGKGKMWIHTAGETQDTSSFAPAMQTMSNNQDGFLESMAEAAGSVINKVGRSNIVYVSLMNNLSIDCDCDSHPAPPELDDIGILASTDPVALDQACVDLIYAADAKKSASLRKRMESRHGIHTVEHAEAIGLGSRKYKLINV